MVEECQLLADQDAVLGVHARDLRQRAPRLLAIHLVATIDWRGQCVGQTDHPGPSLTVGPVEQVAVAGHAGEEPLLITLAPHPGEEPDDPDVHVEGEGAGRIAAGQLLDAAGRGPDVRPHTSEPLRHVEAGEPTLLEERTELVGKGVVPVVLRTDTIELDSELTGLLDCRVLLVSQEAMGKLEERLTP